MSGILAAIGLGKFGTNGHPIHPAVVHLPIAFLLTSSGLDLLTYIGLYSPDLLGPLVTLTGTSTTTSLLSHLSLFSYASTIAGIVTAVPAVLTGGAELFAMYQAKGSNAPTVKTTMLHAALNDLSIFGAVFNWWTRRGTEGYIIDGRNAAISGLMLVGVIYSAGLGGGLVYDNGVAVQRMGKGQRKKAKFVDEKKEL